MLIALSDLHKSIFLWRLWALLGWLEIRQRYARSFLGPFWLTISMGVMIGSIGTVYSILFDQEISNYLPFLAVSLVLWGMFSGMVQDGCLAYINSSAYISQMATPKLMFVFQVVWRNLIVLAHNFVIIIVLLALFGVKNWGVLLFFIPGLLVFVLNTIWVAMVVGLISARFRDMPPIIGALLQIAFYVTPILYRPDSLRKFSFIAEWNPLAYLLDVARLPLIGQMPSLMTWGITLGMMIVGWAIALILTSRYLNRIAYWV